MLTGDQVTNARRTQDGRRPPVQQGPPRHRFAGIHLSGPNAHKTSVVILSLSHAPLAPRKSLLTVSKVYEKIGAFGSLFSDERLVDILRREGPLQEVFVDSPLTAPPCVECVRPVCPGVLQCDDVSVAYMLALAAKDKRRGGARKQRPINPQSQRLWDVVAGLSESETGKGAPGREPTYSANQAPLVTRARTFQRRLAAALPDLRLKETTVGDTLGAIEPLLNLKGDVRLRYRNFEHGLTARREILERLVEVEFLTAPQDAALVESVVKTVETFQAFVAAWVGALYHWGLTVERPERYLQHEGWVYLPKVVSGKEGREERFEQ